MSCRCRRLAIHLATLLVLFLSPPVTHAVTPAEDPSVSSETTVSADKRLQRERAVEAAKVALKRKGLDPDTYFPLLEARVTYLKRLDPVWDLVAKKMVGRWFTQVPPHQQFDALADLVKTDVVNALTAQVTSYVAQHPSEEIAPYVKKLLDDAKVTYKPGLPASMEQYVRKREIESVKERIIELDAQLAELDAADHQAVEEPVLTDPYLDGYLFESGRQAASPWPLYQAPPSNPFQPPPSMNCMQYGRMLNCTGSNPLQSSPSMTCMQYGTLGKGGQLNCR